MTARLVIVLLAIVALFVACERVVDLTPPDAATAVPDASSGDQDATPPNDASIGGGDGGDAIPPDAFIDAL